MDHKSKNLMRVFACQGAIAAAAALLFYVPYMIFARGVADGVLLAPLIAGIAAPSLTIGAGLIGVLLFMIGKTGNDLLEDATPSDRVVTWRESFQSATALLVYMAVVFALYTFFTSRQ